MDFDFSRTTSYVYHFNGYYGADGTLVNGNHVAEGTVGFLGNGYYGSEITLRNSYLSTEHTFDNGYYGSVVSIVTVAMVLKVSLVTVTMVPRSSNKALCY